MDKPVVYSIVNATPGFSIGSNKLLMSSATSSGTYSVNVKAVSDPTSSYGEAQSTLRFDITVQAEHIEN
jgi:hypothetical protein